MIQNGSSLDSALLNCFAFFLQFTYSGKTYKYINEKFTEQYGCMYCTINVHTLRSMHSPYRTFF